MFVCVFFLVLAKTRFGVHQFCMGPLCCCIRGHAKRAQTERREGQKQYMVYIKSQSVSRTDILTMYCQLRWWRGRTGVSNHCFKKL